MMVRRSACKVCREEVVWATWQHSRILAPFDRVPTLGGRVVLSFDEVETTAYLVPPNGSPLHTPHACYSLRDLRGKR